MKKLLTSVITLVLVLCCFTFVGCGKDKDPVNPVTIEQTLTIIEDFVTDIQTVKTMIFAEGYVYPTTDALIHSTEVSDTDKSSLDIEYSSYEDFVFDEDVRELYKEMCNKVLSSRIISYLEAYKHNNLQLNTVYRFNNTEGEGVYLKLTNYNSEIRFSVGCLGAEFIDYYDIIIHFNNNEWYSFELKYFQDDVNVLDTYEEKFGFYLENSTHGSRLFDKVTKICYLGDNNYEWDDIDEKVQKMFHENKLGSNGIPNNIDVYLRSIRNSVENNIDTINAVDTKVTLSE